LSGQRAGFTRATCPVVTYVEAVKYIKNVKNVKSVRNVPYVRSVLSTGYSRESLLELLQRGTNS
jgi:hypothetical protein